MIIRNYNTAGLDRGGSYSGFLATRLLRLSTGYRYEGAIHEHWSHAAGSFRTMLIRNALFHHDGYVYQDQARLQEKHDRNMTLLRAEVEEHPRYS